MGRSEAGLTAACTVKQAGPEEMAGKWCLVACLVAATVLATRAAADKPAQDGDAAESQSIIQESNIQELEQIRQQREAFPEKEGKDKEKIRPLKEINQRARKKEMEKEARQEKIEKSKE